MIAIGPEPACPVFPGYADLNRAFPVSPENAAVSLHESLQGGKMGKSKTVFLSAGYDTYLGCYSGQKFIRI